MIRQKTPQTLRDYLAEYCLTREIDAETIRQYGISVSLFDRWYIDRHGRSVRLEDLDELEVSSWLRDYAASGKAASTVRSKRTQIVSLWKQAADDGYVEPPRKRIRSVRVVLDDPESWTRDEIKKLLQVCQRLPRTHKCGLRRSAWWSLAVRLAWDTGLRWGDLIRLRVDQVTADGLVALPQHKTKRIVVCRISQPTLELLRQTLVDVPRDLVVPWPSSHETFNDQVRRIVAKAGIRPGTWKWVRRAGATDVEIQLSGSAGRFLGHAPGSRIAYTNYVSQKVLAEAGNMAWPRPLDDEMPRPVAT
jgi:integrase